MTTTQDREKFGTYIRDSLGGIDYARNRYYSSTLGRFLSSDPANRGMRMADPGTFNRYAYTSGDPVNRNDPSGLDDEGGDEGDGVGGGEIPDWPPAIDPYVCVIPASTVASLRHPSRSDVVHSS